jgi:hypothetical protein
MTQSKQDLIGALELFIKEMRCYIVSLLSQNFEAKWSDKFREILPLKQQMNWDKGLNGGISPNDLIDFHYLNSFSIGYKGLLQPQFGKKTNSLPTWFGEIAEVRNSLTHFTALNESDATKGWIHMISIAQILCLTDLEESLKKIRLSSESVNIESKKVKKDIVNELSQQPGEERQDENLLNSGEQRVVKPIQTEVIGVFTLSYFIC